MLALTRRTPWPGMFSFHRRFDPFFNEGLADTGPITGQWHPAVDIFEEKDRILIQAELPGVEKKDIVIDLKDRVLTLKGERTVEKEGAEKDYSRRERIFGCFERAFTLPAGLDPEKIRADYKNGVLTIELPKPEIDQPRQITIH
jgi:HSP20 family protein